MTDPVEPIFLGYVEGPDDGMRWEDGNMYYYPDLDQRDATAKAYTAEAIASIPPGLGG